MSQGHELVVGMTGTGKSYWVLYKIISSLKRGTPCCYIDPKGDTYRALLSFFSSTSEGKELWERWKHKIVLMNPVSKSGHLVSFNAIKPFDDFLSSNPDRLGILVNSLMSQIRRESGFEMGDAIRMQNIMAAGIGTLIDGGLTLAELPFLYLPHREGKVVYPLNPVVKQILPKISHHGTREFWELQWQTWPANARREWVQSTEGRVYKYLFDTRVLYSTCVRDNASLDFHDTVKEGKWLFVNLPFPLLDTATSLLGNLIISKIFYSCMQTSHNDYRLILDEAGFFNTGPLDTILETSRAYNLWMTLVVQSLDQMCRVRGGNIDFHLRETALNNARYMSIFRDDSDAELLAKRVFPLTGRMVGAAYLDGRKEYLPVQAELDVYKRRFMSLSTRQVVLHDKFSSETVKVRLTPELYIGDTHQIAMFEAQHLQLTGRPEAEIKREILERQASLRQAVGLPAFNGLPALPAGVPASSSVAPPTWGELL